jgi:ABC-type uncharacterized transport system ATPase subunit
MALDSRTTPALLERDAELQAVEGAAEAARGGAGSLIVIDGPAGVGKTALMDAARAAAASAGLQMLTARGAEMERAFAYGIVRQLLDGAVRGAAAPAEVLFAAPRASPRRCSTCSSAALPQRRRRTRSPRATGSTG